MNLLAGNPACGQIDCLFMDDLSTRLQSRDRMAGEGCVLPDL